MAISWPDDNRKQGYQGRQLRADTGFWQLPGNPEPHWNLTGCNEICKKVCMDIIPGSFEILLLILVDFVALRQGEFCSTAGFVCMVC